MSFRSSLAERKLSLIAFILTLLILVVTKLRETIDDGILEDYGLPLPVFYAACLGLAAAALLLVIVEPYLRQRVPRPAAALLAGIAALLSFGVVLLIHERQGYRTFQFPFNLWLLIVNCVGLCAVLLWTLARDPHAQPSARLLRSAWLVPLIGGGLLVALHIASVGELMRLDLPDEPWLASMATHYAYNGDLSPSYLGSAYGTPDPALGRYYLLMGLWVSLLNDSSLVALRAFSLLIGAVVVIIFAAFLWRSSRLTPYQCIFAIVVLLTSAAFVRTSHNLRMDIGLGVYSVVLLWGLVAFFDAEIKRFKWPFIMGLALYIGLETVPTLTLLLAFLTGLAFVIWSVRQIRQRWLFVAGYALGCLLAGLAFLAGHFLPDPAAQWEAFQAFSRRYASGTNFGEARDIWNYLFNFQVRFSTSLSPLELLAGLLAFALLWRQGTQAGRILVLLAFFQAAIMVAFLNTSFGYWVLFAPWVAYALASALRTRGWLMIGSFALLPALLAAPTHDFVYDISRQSNQKTIAQTDALVPQFPENITLVGEPVFWFSLHQQRNFIGWTGVGILQQRSELSTVEMLQRINPAAVICLVDDGNRCERTEGSGLFSRFTEVKIDSQNFRIYWR